LLLIRDYLRLNYGVSPDAAKQICLLLNFKKNTKEKRLNMDDVKENIFKLYGITIPIPVISHIYFGLIFDCIRGYDQNIAWFGWNNKMINSQNKIIMDVFTKCKDKGGHFLEHTLIGKFRAIISKINELQKNGNNEIKILNETEQKIKISVLKQERIDFYKEMIKKRKSVDMEELDDDEILDKIGWRDPPTPDLLFNRPVMINGSLINWMDSKNFLITHQDKVKYRQIMKQCAKYTKAFGNGAIVSLGFVKTHKKIKNDVMFLDASYWLLSF